ncbi:MAG: hypothetical protein ABSA78_01435 [Candidatus Sulfotelmatobacter sp.]
MKSPEAITLYALRSASGGSAPIRIGLAFLRIVELLLKLLNALGEFGTTETFKSAATPLLESLDD